MWAERNGPVWRIRETIGGRKVTLATGYSTKAAAGRAMITLRAEALRGDALVPRGGQMLLSDFVETWWSHYLRSLKPTAVHSEGGRLRNHILHLLGHLSLDQVDALAVQQWVSDLSDGVGGMPAGVKRPRRALAAKTVHNCHGLLFVIMSAAVAQRLIRLNPCASTALPKREHYEMRFLTDPEIARLVAALPTHWRPLVMLLVATGLRWGEAVGLRVGRVDLLARTPKLLVIEHLHELASTGEIVFTDPKSRMSRRTVSFPRQVALELAALAAGKDGDELLFTAPRGGPVRTRNFRRVWLATCQRAGVGGLRVHDLRHTHAAILISAGRPLSAISRRLGHSSIAVTDSLYGHLREEVDEGILAAVEAAISLVGADGLRTAATFETAGAW